MILKMDGGPGEPSGVACPVMPARLPLLLLLALLGASAASAQEAVPVSAPAPALPPPPLVSAPEEDTPLAPPPRAEPFAAGPSLDALPPQGEVIPRQYVPGTWDERIVPRVGLEVVGGAAGGFVGGGAGFLLGLALGATTVGCTDEACLVTALVGGLAGLGLGVPAGTYLGAALLDGRGTFAAAIGGSILGWGGTLLGLLATGSSSDALSVALLMLPVAGASVAYEISHANHFPQALPATAAASPRVVPLAGFTPSGPRLGLAGIF